VANFGLIDVLDSGGQGFYHGLILSGQRRLSGGATVTANYTWSHCIGDRTAGGIGAGGGAYTQPGNPKFDRGNCTTSAIDTRHVLAMSAVLQTPKFSNHTTPHDRHGLNFAPLLKIQSGTAMTLTTSNDAALTGIPTQRVSKVSDDVYGPEQAARDYST